MSRPKRFEKILGFHLQQVERQSHLLEIRLGEAELNLRAFSPHYDAILAFRHDLRRLLNLLNDRPADYRERSRGPMTG